VTLAEETPTLEFLPAGPGPHPAALLAHGPPASKETLFATGRRSQPPVNHAGCCIRAQEGLPCRLMNADIFKTSRKRTFLFMPQGNPISSVPQDVLDKLKSLQYWKTVELAPNIIGVNPKAITADFEKQGYSIGSVR
jgi:hypothetical protein